MKVMLKNPFNMTNMQIRCRLIWIRTHRVGQIVIIITGLRASFSRHRVKVKATNTFQGRIVKDNTRDKVLIWIQTQCRETKPKRHNIWNNSKLNKKIIPYMRKALSTKTMHLRVVSSAEDPCRAITAPSKEDSMNMAPCSKGLTRNLKCLSRMRK